MSVRDIGVLVVEFVSFGILAASVTVIVVLANVLVWP